MPNDFTPAYIFNGGICANLFHYYCDRNSFEFYEGELYQFDVGSHIASISDDFVAIFYRRFESGSNDLLASKVLRVTIELFDTRREY